MLAYRGSFVFTPTRHSITPLLHCSSAPLLRSSSRMIEVQNLTKRYGEFSAVDRITFSVPKGEIFGFLGPNGAGKTTTIKMLTTVLKPTEGSIRINGLDPVRDQAGVRRTFGIVFQDPSLDESLTAFEIWSSTLFYIALTLVNGAGKSRSYCDSSNSGIAGLIL